MDGEMLDQFQELMELLERSKQPKFLEYDKY